MMFVIFALLSVVMRIRSEIVCDPIPGTPPLSPFGKGLGIKPGRVSWVYNRNSTTWDGTNSTFWWELTNLDLDTVKSMLKKVVLSVVDQEDGDLKAAWDKIFKYHNERTTGKNEGYKKGQTIVSKINLNGNFFTYDSNQGNQVSPQFLVALTDQLVNVVGVAEKDIYYYDASRIITKNFWEPPQGLGAYFKDVQLVDNPGGIYYTTKVQPDEDSYLQFSDLQVPAWNLTKIPTIVQNADYMMEINDFRGHNGAGFTGSGKNWYGSIYRPDTDCTWPDYTPPPHYDAGHWCPQTLHPFDTPNTNPMGSYNPFIDLLGHPKLGGNVLIYLMDGLYGGLEETKKTRYNSTNKTVFSNSWPIKWASYPFNNWWTSSVFASLDPVALDSVQFDFIRNEPNIPYSRTLGCVDNYLHEAAKLPNPPSKTIYNPSGDKPLSEPLGVHEHWNNAGEKKYSRNLGKDVGIEFIQIMQT